MSYLDLATERLNYCSKAIDFMTEQARSPTRAKEHALQDRFIQPLADAIKFIAPFGGQYFEDIELGRKAAASVPNLRLPYDVMAIEFPSNDANFPRQIALAMSMEENERRRFARLGLNKKDDYGAAVFAVVNPATHPDAWVAMPGMAILRFVADGLIYTDYQAFDGYAGLEGTNLDEQNNAVTQLIAALYHGVRYVDLPAPNKLNEKRARKGECQLFEYKLLELHPRIVRLVDDAIAESENEDVESGTRRGPRLHSRRGHWRHYETGKVGWVRPALVGKKDLGIILKDYHTEALRK